jgi:hypothetical protein
MPGTFAEWLAIVGALFFGVVVGWVTYGSLRRANRSGLTDITTIIGAIGGAAITKLFPAENGAFGAYCIGLAIGFFAYLKEATKPDAPDWLGEKPAGQAMGAAVGGRPRMPKLPD